MVFAQNKTCVELLACLARQAFEDRRSPGSYQITDIVLGKERAADFTEDVKVAALVPAFRNFGIDAHTLIAAFGAVVGGIGLLYLWSKGKEFLANRLHIGVDALCELLGWHLSSLDGGKGQFPRACHLCIGNSFILDNLIDCQAFLCRDYRFLFSSDIVSQNQCLDDIGTSGWCTDAALCHCSFTFCICDLFPCVFHSRKQSRFCIERFGLGLVLGNF